MPLTLQWAGRARFVKPWVTNSTGEVALPRARRSATFSATYNSRAVAQMSLDNRHSSWSRINTLAHNSLMLERPHSLENRGHYSGLGPICSCFRPRRYSTQGPSHRVGGLFSVLRFRFRTLQVFRRNNWYVVLCWNPWSQSPGRTIALQTDRRNRKAVRLQRVLCASGILGRHRMSDLWALEPW